MTKTYMVLPIPGPTTGGQGFTANGGFPVTAPPPCSAMAVGRYLLGVVLFLCLWGLALPVAGQERLPLSLTAEERAWLVGNPDKLTLFFNTDFPPIEFAGESGKFVGMGADVIQRLEELLGVKFVKVPSTDWNRHLAALESGACAIAPTIVRTADRERYAFFTAPYATVPVVLITTAATKGTVTLGSLPGRRVGVVSGYATERYLGDLAQGRFDVVPVASVSEGLHGLSFGQLDAFVENFAVAAYHIDKEGIPNLRVAGRTDYAFAWSIGVSRHYPLLFSALQKALAAIPPEELEALRKHWISLDSGAVSPETLRILQLAAFFVFLLVVSLGGASYLLKRRLGENVAHLNTTQEALRQSESRFRSLFEMAPLPLSVISPEGKILMSNRRMVEVLGYTLEEVPTVDHWWSLAYPDASYRRRVMASWNLSVAQAMAEKSEVEPGEFRVLCKDGVERTMVIGASSIGEGLLVYFFDISERKQAEEVLDRERRNLQAILHASPIASLVFDGSGRVVDANPAFEQLFGIKQSQWQGGRWGDLSQCDNRLRRLDGCGLSVNCLNCVFARAIRTALAGNARIRDEEAEAVLSFAGVPRHLWLQFSIEPFMLNGQNHAIMALEDITERKRTEEALRASEEKLRSLFGAIKDIILILDKDGRYVEIAPTDATLLYRPPEELLGQTLADIFPPEKAAEFLTAVHNVLDDGRQVSLDYQLTIDGREVWFLAIVAPLSSERVIWIARDITERKRAEEEREKLQGQLLQSQKLEAIGILAGGVAHDFNNMLSAIIGYTELTLGILQGDDPLRANLGKILDAAHRSAGLTRQLLAFARKQTVAPVILDLNAAVANTLKMLRRLIGENIELRWLPGPKPCIVRMDPTQIDQLLANLCVNARDAIGDIGSIVIETENVVLDENYCLSQSGCIPGDYVLLAVSDDGFGMDKKTMEHIFDPFFTTKGLGQGTGLGLATVYGVVKQNEGFINVYSEPGSGTTFRIYIPRHTADAVPALSAVAEDIPRGAGEAILLVEDDPTILEMTTMMLRQLGYTVFHAASPEDALRLAEGSGELHMFLTDVVMPKMNGKELAKRLRLIRPQLPGLFMSGYTSNIIVHQGILDDGLNFLQKPFTQKELAVKIRRVLDEAKSFEPDTLQ